jgi:general secretion pathway protein A
MYHRSFGLLKNPFNMTPDPAFLLMTPQHREALAGLTYAILQCKGFMVLAGEAGTGKTTLLTRTLQFLPRSRVQCSVIVHPTLTASEFLEMVLLDFGITEVPASKAQRLWKLQTLLIDGHRKGKISALIVDEAHKLSLEVLEEIRLLGNFEDADRKLLQILLVGQTELDDLLNREDLRQLKQRIALRVSLGPLASPDVAQYIRHRWTTAGGGELPFSSEALIRIAGLSRSIPRIINSLCENSLMLALAEGVKEADVRHVQLAATDLQLTQLVVEPHPVEQKPLPDILDDPLKRTVALAGRRSGWPKWRERLGLDSSEETH